MSRLCVASTAVLDRLRQRLPDSELVAQATAWSDIGVIPDDAADIEFWVPPFLIYDLELAQRAAQSLPNLQVIQTQSAGVEVMLQFKPAGVTLCDGRGVHGSSTSEWALTAILSMLREFPRFERAQAEHRWDYGVTDELAGKSVLIIGAGDIGQQLARRLRACDAEVVFAARTARAGVHGIDEVPTLLPAADVVVLIVPKTSETIGMVGPEFLARLKDGALLVNAARGQVVQTDALLAELQTGRLRAAVDVTDPEPLPADHPLWSAPNLLITPHIAGSVLGLTDRFISLLAAQVTRFDNGEPLQNVVEGEY